MMAVGGFVHLYHVWGILGLLTAWTYARVAFSLWRARGGEWSAVPGELGIGALRQLWLVARDVALVVRGLATGALFSAMPGDDPKEWRYGREMPLLLGIMAGGVARLVTAFYWSVRNTAWMNHSPEILVAGLPVTLAIAADILHQVSAHPRELWRARLLAGSAVSWVAIGAWLWA